MWNVTWINKFSTWYGNEILKQLDEAVNIDAVDVKLRLTTLKPLHAQWVVDFNNEMAAIKGKHIIESGWRVTGITDAICLGSKNLPATDHWSFVRWKQCQRLQAICALI